MLDDFCDGLLASWRYCEIALSEFCKRDPQLSRDWFIESKFLFILFDDVWCVVLFTREGVTRHEPDEDEDNSVEAEDYQKPLAETL